jgi:hypothetical protein
MIEILTLVKTTDERGNVSYSVSGGMPLDEAAKALVIIAFTANKTEEKKEEKKSDVVQGDRN